MTSDLAATSVTKSYKPGLAAGSYDAIVIGSGIGGLSVAALLSRQGKKVLVLERHYVAGGFTHTFSRKGYEWDVGVHYIGEVHKTSSILRRLFDYISRGELKWEKMPEVYDKVCIGDPAEVYDYVSGTRNFTAKMKEYFPGEGKAIDDYIRLVYETTTSARSFYTAKVLPAWMGKMAGPFLESKFHRYSDQTTLEVLQKLTDNQKLIGVLAAQYGDYGLPPGQSSFAIHAFVAKHYLDGGNYPVGGSRAIAESIIPVIRETGGDVLVRAEVAEVIVKKGVARGVRLKNGDEILAATVISDAGAINTFSKLLPEEERERLKVSSLLSNVKPSLSHIGLYLGFKKTAEELNLPRHNFWIYPSYDHDHAIRQYEKDPSAALPVTYVSFPSAKDPKWNEAHPGRSTVEIVGFAPYAWFKKWESLPWMKRGEEYEKLKHSLSDRLLDQMYRFLPQLKGQIDHLEISTPLSTRHFCNYEHGEIYGLDHTPSRFRQKWLAPRTPIKGLFLTGQDIVSDGIAGALMGGLLSASAILKKNLAKDVVVP